MAQFKPYKLLKADLGSLPMAEGQLIITTDTKEIYLDTNASTRIKLNDQPDVVTYELSKNGSTITLTGSNGQSTMVTDSDTTYSVVTTSANGLMSKEMLTKLNGIEAGAQKNTITGVKGSAETKYRTGSVNITKANIGLGNVEDKSSATIRGEITATNVTTALGYIPLNQSTKGAANGVAELGADGKVPSSQLPSYVDDVLEYDAKANFPTTGETGKIYVDKATNKTWRWSGTAYVEISASLALGETSSTAFRGDYGKVAYGHAQAKGSAFASGLYKITTNAQGHVTAATAVVKADITALGIPGSNTTYSKATASADGLMSKEDFSKLAGIAANANNYSLPKASATVLGGIKIGTNLSIDSDGKVSATDTKYNAATTSADGLMTSAMVTKLNGIAANANNYSLPTASASTKGGVKVGTGLSIDTNGVLSAPALEWGTV